MEHAIFGQGEHQVASVGRDAREGGTLVHGRSIEHYFARTELQGLRVETLLIKVVFHLFCPLHEFHARVDGVLILEVGAAVVERLAVGCPEGEHFEFVRVVLDVGHLILLHIEGNQVALRVVHLDFVWIDGMESLLRLVRGIDDELQPGMPGGIYAGREQVVVLHVYLAHLAIVGDNRSAQVLAGMELHPVGVVLLVVVAVDALTRRTIGAEHIVVDHALLVVFQTALADGQVLVGDVRGGNQSVADVGVDGIGRHNDVERLIARPLSLVAGIDLHLDGLPPCSLSELSPVAGIGLYLGPAANNLLTAEGETGGHFLGGFFHLERQRRHVHRDGHPGIVGIDLRERL